MNKLLTILSITIATTLSNSALAASIGGYTFADNALVNQVINASGTFYNYNSTSSADAIDFNQLNADLTDANEATYVFTGNSDAYVDLSFGSSIYNGVDNDLAFFFVGDPNTISLSLIGNSSPSQTYTSSMIDGFGVDVGGNTYALSVALVDLDDFNLAADTALGDIRVGLGLQGTSNPVAFSLAAGFHTTPVPLPASLVLFLSGLASLGFIRRRKK
ncbi:MAG: VPLPA-CTERM sorting domain-containing protein [Gammaproteobacteria bacterium]|nr:VPLPA-CTERM sorting domain-containing protein [Gammaproteobacteria bacterium]